MTTRGELRIDLAESAEAEFLAELNRQLDEDEPYPYRLPLSELAARMTRWITTGEYQVLLFRCGNSVIGYAVWRLEDRGAYLRHFFICRDQRRAGWGRQVMRILCRDVFPKDRPVQLETAIGNKTGIAFWHALGFQDFGLSMELPPGAISK